MPAVALTQETENLEQELTVCVNSVCIEPSTNNSLCRPLVMESTMLDL